MTSREPRRVLFIFLDGVGIGPPNPVDNPFFAADLPNLRELLGGIPSLEEPRLETEHAVSLALDARLGVEGTPQSGTGQAALLTGRNAARIFGRHFGPWTPVALRPLVIETSVLARTLATGASAAFANAYPEQLISSPRFKRPAGFPLAALGAGLLNRHAGELRRGEAVASEIVNSGWRRRLGMTDLPDVTAAEAGRILVRIAKGHQLTVFAHYSTDHAGHRGGRAGSVRALERVDEFLGGVMKEMPAEMLGVIASDHGNIEEMTGGHTLNPTLFLGLGPLARSVLVGEDDQPPPRSIADVPEVLLRYLRTA